MPAIYVRQLGDCVLCAAWRHRQSTLGHTGMSLRARHLKTLCNWLLPGDAAQVAAVMVGNSASAWLPHLSPERSIWRVNKSLQA